MSVGKYLPVLTIDCGQSDDGTCRVFLWTTMGRANLGSFKFVWDIDADGIKWYNLQFLLDFWTRRHKSLKDGRSLLELILHYGVKAVGGTFWGADLITLDANGQPKGAVNYPSFHKHKEVSDAFDDTTPWWHLELGGALHAGHQPYFNLLFLKKRVSWEDVAAVVPVSDFIFSLLANEQRHDVTMSKTLGLFGDAKENLLNRFGAPLTRDMLCPWETLGDKELVDRDGLLVGPISHDTSVSRPIGFAFSPAICWTGTWVGTSWNLDGIDLRPNETTRDSRACFEGGALNFNTAMAGDVFAALVKAAEGEFDDVDGNEQLYAAVSEFALEQRTVPILDLEESLQGETEEVCPRLIGICGSSGLESTSRMAAATLLRNVSTAAVEQLRKLSEVVDRPLVKVAVTGGWAINTAFCKFLTDGGFEVISPDGAQHATRTASAIDLVWRSAHHRGDPITMDVILKELPVQAA